MKRTIYLDNPCYLHTRDEQLVIHFPDNSNESVKSLPIEDLGVVIIDHPQITIGQVLIQKLLENNFALVCCDKKHQPIGLMLNLDGHTLQSATFLAQVEAPLPLKKQLWQQTIVAKICNQASLIERYNMPSKYLFQLSMYIRYCSSRESAEVHQLRVKKNLPPYGHVGIFMLTDKQFAQMEVFHGKRVRDAPTSPKQLEMF
jgi:CRISPR-associated protein Cas1